MELTKQQKTFILNTFFKHEKYPGWENIATKLIETGTCVVAGKGCIWHDGGIGNFIDTQDAPEHIGCTQYTFNLSLFMKSEWFIEEIEDYEGCLIGNIKSLEASLKEIQSLRL